MGIALVNTTTSTLDWFVFLKGFLEGYGKRSISYNKVLWDNKTSIFLPSQEYR